MHAGGCLKRVEAIVILHEKISIWMLVKKVEQLCGGVLSHRACPISWMCILIVVNLKCWVCAICRCKFRDT